MKTPNPTSGSNPQTKSENGSEFVSRDMDLWAYQRGVTLDFWRINMRPGKPLMFGTRGKTLVFGLPGNPVSSLVCFELFVRPALERLSGRPAAKRQFIPGRLASPFVHHGDRPTYHPGECAIDGESTVATPLRWRVI